MSESYAVLPITTEVRAWLEDQGCSVPEQDGRAVTLVELKQAIASLPNVQSEWKTEGPFQGGHLRSVKGSETLIVVGDPGFDRQACEFHFRGGEAEFIVEVVSAVAARAGPQAVYAHSGAFLQVVG